MRKGRNTVRAVILVAVLAAASLIAAIAGFGHAYQSVLTVQSHGGSFEGIRADAWIADGASIRFPNLVAKGNRVELAFDSWRPNQLPPAQLQVSLCGALIGEFEAGPVPVVLPLKGDCQPKELLFSVKNPFEVDGRKLGVKIKSVTITSRLGIPLVSLEKVLSCAAGIFFLSLLVLGLSGTGVLSLFAVAVPVAAFFLIASDSNVELRTQYPLWVFSVSISAGCLLAALLARHSTRMLSSAERNPKMRGWFEIGAIFLIVTAGGILRFYGIRFGLPANYHPDEVPKVNAIMRMVDSHSLNPTYFLHPSLLLYSSYFTNTVFHWLGMQGEFRTTAFLAGRTVSACAGTFSLYLVYCLGRRLFSVPTGLVAAALLAVFPLHVTCSRYMKEDALLTFFVIAVILAVVKAVQEDKKGYLLLGGALAGCAFSTKYSGLLAAGIVLAAPWLKSQKFVPDFKWVPWSIAALLLVPVFFVACSPYTVITPDKFIKDFRSESHHMERGHTVTITAWSQLWMYHFWRSLFPGMTGFSALLGTAAVGFLLWRRRIDDLFIVGLVLLFYLPAEWVKAKPEPQPERYVVPCLPFMALALAEMVRAASRNRAARLVMPALAVFAVVSPAVRSTRLASEVPHDTRTRMAYWMNENLPRGSKIAVDWKPYGPPVSPKRFSPQFMIRSSILFDLRVKALKASGYDYVVLSSLFYDRYFTQPHTHGMLRQLFRDVYEQVPVVKEISPKYGTYGFNNPKLTLFSLKTEDFAKLDEERELKREGKLDRTSNEVRAQFRWSGK